MSENAAAVRPWTRCAVCGFRKWTHWTFRRGDEGRTFYTTRGPLTPPPPKRGLIL